MYFNIEIGIVD